MSAHHRDMNRADLINILTNIGLDGHRSLSRVQARAVVNEVFMAIKEALRNGELVRLPLGVFGVYEHDRKEPTRGWYLGRVRVLYQERNQIVFRGDEHDLEPTEEPRHVGSSSSGRSPRRLKANHDDIKPAKVGPRRGKLSPAERRKRAVIGVKAKKSKRAIAKELGVSDTTIARDLKSPAKYAKKKSATTRRKPGAPPKVGRHKGISPKPSVSNTTRSVKGALGKSSDSERLTTAEDVRQQRLQEMVELVHSWLAERRADYHRATSVVDKARNRLNASSHAYFDGMPEPSMSAAELRDQSRPQEMDSAMSQRLSRREEVCAKWLARWMAEWEPRDEALRYEVLNQVRSKQRVYPVFA